MALRVEDAGVLVIPGAPAGMGDEVGCLCEEALYDAQQCHGLVCVECRQCVAYSERVEDGVETGG
jgi:hypothetical protein